MRSFYAFFALFFFLVSPVHSASTIYNQADMTRLDHFLNNIYAATGGLSGEAAIDTIRRPYNMEKALSFADGAVYTDALPSKSITGGKKLKLPQSDGPQDSYYLTSVSAIRKFLHDTIGYSLDIAENISGVYGKCLFVDGNMVSLYGDPGYIGGIEIERVVRDPFGYVRVFGKSGEEEEMHPFAAVLSEYRDGGQLKWRVILAEEFRGKK